MKSLAIFLLGLLAFAHLNANATCVDLAPGIQTTNLQGLDYADNSNPNTTNGSYVWGYDGTGVNVYVVDVDMHVGNSEYGGRATQFYDALHHSASGFPFETPADHGDGMASMIGGHTWGIAKCVSLKSVKASDDGSISAATVTDAINWIRLHGSTPAVINISASPNVASPADQAALTTAINSAISSGYFVVGASGNNGGDACANQVFQSIPDVFTVGGFDYFNSQHGACLDMFAIGFKGHGSTSTGGDTQFDGTSSSAAYVSGAAALILDEFPSASPRQVSWELIARSTRGLMHSINSNFDDSPDRILNTISLGYTNVPTSPASFDVTRCGVHYDVNWTRASYTVSNRPTFLEMQRSGTATFTSPVSLFYDGLDATGFFSLATAANQYFRVRECNSLGCSAFVTAPAGSCAVEPPPLQ